MRIKDANTLRKDLAQFPVCKGGRSGAVSSIFISIINAIDKMPEIEVVPLEEYKALEKRVRELEKQLSDVSSSPFDGCMSQKEYFHGETDCERRERWVLIFENPMPSIVGGRRYRWKCTGCGAGIETKELRPPAEHRCYICGACMDWGVSDG